MAEAIVEKAKEKSLEIVSPTEFQAISGRGIVASVNGSKIIAGNEQAIKDQYGNSENFTEVFKKGNELAAEGKTPMYFGKDGKLLGIIAVADTIKKDSKEAIQALKNRNIDVFLRILF